jgi:hypothetical protein
VKVALLMVILTAAIYGATQTVPRFYGPDVKNRVLEKGFLAKNPYDTAAKLEKWIKDDPNAARDYVFPVLFPIDLLFLVFLGATLAMISAMAAGSIGSLSGIMWLFVLVPALYVAADLAEDTLLAVMLTFPTTISETVYGIVQVLTTVKIVSVLFALAQTAILFVAALILRH